jgi:ubiquinone/menaquinone biosynthesis C-methylase UbiE
VSRSSPRSAAAEHLDEHVRAYYEGGVELGRLDQGYSRIEFARTKELLARHFPSPPASVLDVGGGPGVYAEWLAETGFRVHLVDGSPLHVEQATERSAGRFTAAAGDARALDEPDDGDDAVLLMGPLYHLTERSDRLAALREARRVMRSGGVLVATAISRFASLLDGLHAGYLREPAFWPILERDLADGQHRSPDNKAFTTAFFHRVEELHAEAPKPASRSRVFTASRVRGGWFEARGTTRRLAQMSCRSPARSSKSRRRSVSAATCSSSRADRGQIAASSSQGTFT